MIESVSRRRGARGGFWGWICVIALLSACQRTDARTETASASVTKPQARDAAPAPAALASAPVESPEADPLIAMGEIAGVQCQPSGAGLLACKAPGYEISGADHACAEDGASFGQVFDDAVTLVDRFPADGATPIAQLPKGQFLCVQFVAESVSGGDGWVYVTAVAPSLISRCSGNATCGAGGLAPKWAGATPVGECKVGVEGRYAQACPAGWLPRAAVEEFSMGL